MATKPIVDQVIEGKMQMFCSEIRLERKTDKLNITSGPGIVEINAGGKFEYLIHISAEQYHALFFNNFTASNRVKLIFQDEDFFQLTATDYSGVTWTGRVLAPTSGGVLGSYGIAQGTVSELRSTKDAPSTKTEYVTFHVRGNLDFPALHPTKRKESRGRRTTRLSVGWDYTRFEAGRDVFVISRSENYITIESRLRPGSVAKHRHIRMQEALGFALGQPIWPCVTQIYSNGKRIEILRPPDSSTPVRNVYYPPLSFSTQQRGDTYKIAAAYYRKLYRHVGESEHVISKGVSLLMQGLQTTIEIQVLAMAVAAESLIRNAFPTIRKISRARKRDAKSFTDLARAKVITVSPKMNVRLSAEGKQRLESTSSDLLRPSARELLNAFAERFNVEKAVVRAWGRSRNPALHGNPVDYSKISAVVDERWKILYLCNVIVLAYIDYHGSHTRYDVLSHPTRDWNPKPKSEKQTTG